MASAIDRWRGKGFCNTLSTVPLVREHQLVMELSCITVVVVVARWLWLFFFIHATLPVSAVVESVASKDSANATDALALLAFKHQLLSDSLSTWNDSLHFCQWQGITCGRRHSQRVVAMNLTRLQLVGPLSPFIANLTFIRVIDLSRNKLHGQIPPEIGRLFRLRHLNLRRNSLGGEIPTNLTHCWRLIVIDFNHNNLTGRIPVELGSLSRLNELILSFNSLTGSIPTSFGNLSSLTNLSVDRNELEGNIPEELGQIRNLFIFSISVNKLSGTIPPTLYNCSSMAIFSITQNQLSGSLPPDLGVTLPNLIGLYVGANQFTGPIPISLSNASRLEILGLSKNRFTGSIPTNLGRLRRLHTLSLQKNLLGSGGDEDMGFLSSLTNCSLLNTMCVSNNRLTGALPNSITNLSTNLQNINLGFNRIFGSLPSGIGNLQNLISLAMHSNFMTGKIPESIEKLNKLQALGLSKNDFSDEIPASIGNLTQLSDLFLDINSLQGIIPSTLKNCKQLSRLLLHHNDLTGVMPKQIFSITTLRILDLGANSLVGSLPTEVGNSKSLQVLHVSDNKLSGEIPKTLDNCLSLEHLFIEGNFFQGAFPSLIALKGMLRMDISSNNFSGLIPTYLEKLRHLQYLNLSYNDFEGEVPQEGIFKNASAISIIGNKKLCGASPTLLLPKCPSEDSKKQSQHFPKKQMIAILIGSVICSVLLFLILYYYCIRKSKKQPHPRSITHPLEELLTKISYGDLCKATDGFSSANLIGVGSYGSVYKGYLDHIMKIVAVKVLNLQRQGASKSFIVECTALRNIRHRNLLKVLTVCSSIDFKGDDFKALVFDYIAKGNLEHWLHPSMDAQDQPKNLNLIQRLNIAVDVASALNYLHTCCEKTIVHCDLKPSNILLDNDMNALVGDFGLARFLSEGTNIGSQNDTNSPGIRGTIGYVAPEYGMGNEVSTFGDIYSYGTLLLEIFTGKKPTDEIFNGSLSLHQFAKLALPERVMEIVDQNLLSLEFEGLNESQTHTNAKSKLEKCLISTITVGVACSAISIKDRMDIEDATVEMQRIRDLYIRVEINDTNN
ncbi:hypothetical protein MRB53_022516 [Persea americana]|uniref:Uncharacterized protein n=1 Tax=Persea americana TaxID=3435 RepID=A0ACC2L744_PERAE|nr:hypothetical protein MRB53_022516 [Persea americana]